MCVYKYSIHLCQLSLWKALAAIHQACAELQGSLMIEFVICPYGLKWVVLRMPGENQIVHFFFFLVQNGAIKKHLMIKSHDLGTGELCLENRFP